MGPLLLPDGASSTSTDADDELALSLNESPDPGDRVVMAVPTFDGYPIFAKIARLVRCYGDGGVRITIGRRPSTRAVLAAIRTSTVGGTV